MGLVLLVSFAALFGLAELLGVDWGGGNSNSDTDPVGNPETGEDTGPLDTSQTSNGNDRFDGDFGTDAINGQAGNDTLFGLSARGFLEGGTGNDIVRGGDGPDLIGGGAGNDNVLGGSGNDLVVGNGGDDWLSGQGGDDLVIGGSGADTLSGGRGNDILFSYLSAPVDPVADDVLSIDVDIAREFAFQELIQENPDLDQEEIDQRLEAAGLGDDDAPRATGDGQVDRLVGGAGNDQLFLGAGDLGIGGEGGDGFIFSLQNAQGAETLVEDFTPADDYLVVAGEDAAAPEFIIGQDGNDALIQSGGETLARLVGQAGQVTPDDVRYVQLSREVIL